MQAYHYNHLRFYDGTISRQIDPKSSAIAGHDVYLMPANSTDVKPTIQDGYTPRWNGSDWEQYANDKTVYGYTDNDDGTINYYGSAHTEEELQARVKDVDLLFAETEPVSVDGVYWLSADDPAYIEAKKAHDKAEALAELDNQFRIDRATIMEYYTQAVFDSDTETQEELKAEMEEIKDTYAEERKKIEEAD
jgi:hypothetical protein